MKEAPTGLEAKPTEGAERPQVNLMEVLQTSAPGLKPSLGMRPEVLVPARREGQTLKTLSGISTEAEPLSV